MAEDWFDQRTLAQVCLDSLASDAFDDALPTAQKLYIQLLRRFANGAEPNEELTAPQSKIGKRISHLPAAFRSLERVGLVVCNRKSGHATTCRLTCLPTKEGPATNEWRRHIRKTRGLWGANAKKDRPED